MKLNDFTILNMSIGDTDFSDSRDFIKALKSRRMLADVYVDAHKVATSAVWFTEENGWLYANLGCRFALSEPVLAKSILVKVYGAGSNVITMSSFTEVSEYIETGDQEMELHGSVISATPYNSMRKPTKTSKIRWLRSFLITANKLSDLPTDQSVVVEPDDPSVIDDQTDHIVTVNFDAHKQASFDDGNGNTLATFEWNTSRDSQLDFWVVTNDAWPSDETPVIVVDETGELLRRDSESDNPPYYQFHIRKADIENIENRSEITLYIQFASSYSTGPEVDDDDPSDVTSGTLSVQITGSTDLVAQPLWLDDETFSPGFELQVTQNVSHTLMIPLVHGAAEISISDVDGRGLDSDIQYVDPLPDNQQRPDVVKNARVQFTIGVDYVLLSVNVWIAEAP